MPRLPIFEIGARKCRGKPPEVASERVATVGGYLASVESRLVEKPSDRSDLIGLISPCLLAFLSELGTIPTSEQSATANPATLR
jgi:hypothetical protein